MASFRLKKPRVMPCPFSEFNQVKFMKKSLLTILILISMAGFAFLAFIAGHHQGTVRADARSFSLECAVIDDFDRSNGDQARKKLEDLIKFRKKWQSSKLSWLDSWSYWRHVDTEFLNSSSHTN